MPLMSRYSSASTGGPLSMGLPEPLKMRPSMSSDTGVVKILPVNSMEVRRLSMPAVPSKTWTTALVPWTSSTWPERCVPSASVKLTISANIGLRTFYVRMGDNRDSARRGVGRCFSDPPSPHTCPPPPLPTPPVPLLGQWALAHLEDDERAVDTLNSAIIEARLHDVVARHRIDLHFGHLASCKDGSARDAGHTQGSRPRAKPTSTRGSRRLIQIWVAQLCASKPFPPAPGPTAAGADAAPRTCEPDSALLHPEGRGAP